MANSETAADLQAEEAISGDFCLSFFVVVCVSSLGNILKWPQTPCSLHGGITGSFSVPRDRA